MKIPEMQGELFVKMVNSPLPNDAVCDIMTNEFDERERLSQRLRDIGLSVLRRLDDATDAHEAQNPQNECTVVDMFSRRTIS